MVDCYLLPIIMNPTDIRELQTHIGATADGIWGPKSQAACVAHLRALMPSPNPWPTADDRSMQLFYGAPGNVANLVNLDVVGLGLKYEGMTVKTVRVHNRVATSLRAVLEEISAGPNAWVIGYYAGAYNYRAMRNGSRMSKHAWGAALDFWPDHNGLHTPWPTVARMPFGIMESFAREGWIAAGAFWGRDAMHFEATR
jgi:hypothetical protein